MYEFEIWWNLGRAPKCEIIVNSKELSKLPTNVIERLFQATQKTNVDPKLCLIMKLIIHEYFQRSDTNLELCIGIFKNLLEQSMMKGPCDALCTIKEFLHYLVLF